MINMQRTALLLLALVVVGSNCTIPEGRKLLSKGKWESAVAPAIEEAKDWAEGVGEHLKSTFGRKLAEDKHDKHSLKDVEHDLAPFVEEAKEKVDKFGDAIKDAAEHVHDTVKDAFTGRRLSSKDDLFSLDKWNHTFAPAIEEAKEQAEEAFEKFQEASEELGAKFKEAITGRRLSSKDDLFSLDKWNHTIAPAIEEAKEQAEEAFEKFQEASEELGAKFKEAITGRRLSSKDDKFDLKKWQDSLVPAIEEAKENAEEAMEKFRNALG